MQFQSDLTSFKSFFVKKKCFYETEKIGSIFTAKNFWLVSDWLFGTDMEIIVYSPAETFSNSSDEALTPKSLL